MSDATIRSAERRAAVDGDRESLEALERERARAGIQCEHQDLHLLILRQNLTSVEVLISCSGCDIGQLGAVAVDWNYAGVRPGSHVWIVTEHELQDEGRLTVRVLATGTEFDPVRIGQATFELETTET